MAHTQQLYNAGSAISTTVAADRVYALDSAIEGAAFYKTARRCRRNSRLTFNLFLEGTL